jgi:L-arabinonolactonase
LRWDAASLSLWWADVAGDALLSWGEQRRAVRKQVFQDTPQLLASCASGRMLIGMSKRLCLAEMRASGHRHAPLVRTLATIDAADPRIVIGGGRTDRAGNFVFGTCNIAPAPRAIGSFFQFSQRYGLRRLALPTVVSASAVCFSGAGDRMFFADASGGVLWQCGYDAGRATVNHVRPFVEPATGMRIQDALVDCDDSVWSLQAGADDAVVLVCHDSQGQARSITRMAPGALTGLAFAGAELDRLMLLGREGSLRSMTRTALRGLADAPFDDRHYSERELRSQPNPRPPAPR